MKTHNKFKKSTKFESNADIFAGDITASSFDVMFDHLRRYNSVNRDDFIL